MKKYNFAYVAWFMASVFYFYQYVIRVLPNIILNNVINDFSINTVEFGQFSGIYYLGYSLMHLPIGIFLDRFGPRKVMTASILATLAGLIPLVFSKIWTLAVIGRFLTGMGSSGAALGMMNIIRINFDEKRFTRLLGFSVAIGLTGAIYGGGPLNFLCEKFGYQFVVKLFIISGLILALLTYILIKETEIIKEESVLGGLKKVIFNYKILFACFFSGLMLGPLEGFADAWGKEFFKQVYNFEYSLGSKLCSFIFIGMWIGSFILTIIAEKTDYLWTIVISGIIMAISFISLLTGTLSKELIGVIFIIVGIACAYQILVLYKVTTYISKNLSGLATAFTNMITMSFGYGFHSAIGFLIKFFKNDTQSFVKGIMIIPITLIIGILGFIVMKKFENIKK